jgi:hypothetical protein
MKLIEAKISREAIIAVLNSKKLSVDLSKGTLRPYLSGNINFILHNILET